ncbi:MAG TPA: redoxin domain-containing protein [Bacteroidota bacterium]|nr:redoxin domain-containing protein [Bacteroidota bacterium]
MKYLAVLLICCAALSSARELPTLKIGDKAPEFALKNYDGKEYSLPALMKEHAINVVMFIATQCPVSNAYNERMEQIFETYSAKGIGVVAINANKEEDVAAITAHAKEHGFRFPVLKDLKNVIADRYGAQVTPEIFVIVKDGTVAYHGRIDDSRKADGVQSRDLALALDALLAGKQPPKTETKAIGCTIKRIASN